MNVLLITGVVFLAIGYPLRWVLERCGSRWSNLALALCVLLGIVFVGLFAGL